MRTSPKTLLRLVRQRWAIQNEWHWVRDVQLGEDAHRYTKRNGVQTLALLRILGINLLRTNSFRYIRAGLITVAHDINRMLGWSGINETFSRPWDCAGSISMASSWSTTGMILPPMTRYAGVRPTSYMTPSAPLRITACWAATYWCSWCRMPPASTIDPPSRPARHAVVMASCPAGVQPIDQGASIDLAADYAIYRAKPSSRTTIRIANEQDCHQTGFGREDLVNG